MSAEIRINYPRVSDIIGPYSRKDFENIPLETLANAAERGTKVHKYCTGYAQGLWLPEIEKECQPYVESFKKWFDLHAQKVVLSELRLYDDALRFTGEVDLVVELKDGSCVLVDLKTSASFSKSWILQLAAYHSLLKTNGIEVVHTLNLQLKKTGGKAKEYLHSAEDLTKGWDIFKGLIDAYDFFYRKPIAEDSNDS